MAIAVVYGSSTGNASNVAGSICEKLQGELFDVSSVSANELNKFDKFVFGSSTWGCGDFQDDWDSFDWDALELNGKTIALFGLGDQEGYSDTFCDALGLLYEKASEKGAKIVGEWPSDGYEFESSKSFKNGKFVGLAIDTDNQDDQTEERIIKWVESIKSHF